MAKRGPKGPSKYTQAFLNKEAKLLLKYAKEANLPFKQEFAIQQGYPSQYMSKWANESEEFSEALKRLEDIQEIKLVKAMLANKINVTGAIFTLKNVAGWRDRTEHEHSADEGLKGLLKQMLKLA